MTEKTEKARGRKAAGGNPKRQEVPELDIDKAFEGLFSVRTQTEEDDMSGAAADPSQPAMGAAPEPVPAEPTADAAPVQGQAEADAGWQFAHGAGYSAPFQDIDDRETGIGAGMQGAYTEPRSFETDLQGHPLQEGPAIDTSGPAVDNLAQVQEPDWPDAGGRGFAGDGYGQGFPQTADAPEAAPEGEDVLAELAAMDVPMAEISEGGQPAEAAGLPPEGPAALDGAEGAAMAAVPDGATVTAVEQTTEGPAALDGAEVAAVAVDSDGAAVAAVGPPTEEPAVQGATEGATALAAALGGDAGAETAESGFTPMNDDTDTLGGEMVRRRKARPGRTFTRFFVATLLICILVAGSGAVIWAHVLDSRPFQKITTPVDNNRKPILTSENLSVLVPGTGMFKKDFKNSKRVNILLLGNTKEGLSDTIMLASFDPDLKRVDMVSVPRDTYYERTGYAASYLKINACFLKGPLESAKAVHNVLCGVPINYYAVITYDGIANVVDAVGGVPFNVPRDMYYYKPSENLTINLKKGKQVLDGQHALEYIRYRHGYINGDIGRVSAQQNFMKAAFKQALKFNNLPALATSLQKNVDSDIEVKAVTYLVSKISGMSSKDVYTYTLPGIDRNIGGLSFWIRDDTGKVEQMMRGIYTGVVPTSGSAITGGAVTGAGVSGGAATGTGAGSTPASTTASN